MEKYNSTNVSLAHFLSKALVAVCDVMKSHDYDYGDLEFLELSHAGSLVQHVRDALIADCGATEYLIREADTEHFKVPQFLLRDLVSELSEVPHDEEFHITQDFYIWPAGTYLFKIWSWLAQQGAPIQ